jgi:hypothetical protein
MMTHWMKRSLILIALSATGYVIADGCQLLTAAAIPPAQAPQAEAKAIAFLTREVPAWKQNNGCFSCHNNGDAARALYAATRKGYRLAAEVLRDTTAWVSQPQQWEQNKGDPGFSDKKLANLQFAAALLAALEAGEVKEAEPLRAAARKLVNDQSPDGSWKIDAVGTVGSPATWGTPLATWMAVRVLQQADVAATTEARQKAERWLQQAKPNNVLTAATLLLAFASDTSAAAQRKQTECLQLLRRAQTQDGGWGPYADAPPEGFDTAMVLLALAPRRNQSEWAAAIRRGRSFLVAQQNSDGSWPATTRPSGGDSYAQMMSTTGWATLALLETKE